MKVYTYQKCSTCRKATKWLDSEGIAYDEMPIRDTPPSIPELKEMLSSYEGDIRKLFNTSGMDYRGQGLKDKLPTMTESEAIDLLHSNGNLVKRPFLLSQKWNAVGFKEAEWKAHLT